MAIALRFAARSDIGLGRYSNNQDSGYAGQHLLVVCDGMGGHAGGDIASSVALGRLVALDGDSYGGESLSRLATTLREANADIAHRAEDEPVLQGMGTTATILMRYDGKLALAHIGDSRGYLLRDGELSRITRDHTFVQSLVDEGRITAGEAEQHPQRNIVTRVLSGHPDDEPDLSVREARVGDRYLLCSDGLTGVVSDATIAETLTDGSDPARCADALVEMALRGGAPDNVTCVVAEVVEAGGGGEPADAPQVVGSAAVHGTVPTAASPASPAAKAAALGSGARGHGSHGRGSHDRDDAGNEPPRVGPPASRRRWVARSMATVVVLAVLVVGAYAVYAWSRQQYYIGADGESVAIYRGLPQDIGPVSTSEVYELQDIALDDLPEYSREQVRSTITVDDLADARATVNGLRAQATGCLPGTSAQSPTVTAVPSPATTPARTAPPKLTATTPGTPTPTATPSANGCGETR